MQTNNLDSCFLQQPYQTGFGYTSYPAAKQFQTGFDVTNYQQQAQASNDELIPLPLSVYIHIPFCDSLCHDCGCNSEASLTPEQTEPYLAALHKEIALQSALFDPDRKVVQLYIGGGAPTYLSDLQITALMSRLAKQFNLPMKKKREWSIEVDPRKVDLQRIDFLAASGFNYLRLEAQDFDPLVQQAINRLHQAEYTAKLIARAREQGFRSVSVELIYGLPQQSPESFAATISTVAQMLPDRISVYSRSHLSSLFPPQQMHSADIPGQETGAQPLEQVIQYLSAAGYRHLGMAQFALETDELCLAQDKNRLQRNLQGYTTKTQCELLGLGFGAVGRVGNCCVQNFKDLSMYLGSLEKGTLPLAKGLVLHEEDHLRRAVIQQIMCQANVDFAALSYKYHIDFKQHFALEIEILEQLASTGLIKIDSVSLSITPQGWALLPAIARIFDQYLQQQYKPLPFPSIFSD